MSDLIKDEYTAHYLEPASSKFTFTTPSIEPTALIQCSATPELISLKKDVSEMKSTLAKLHDEIQQLRKEPEVYRRPTAASSLSLASDQTQTQAESSKGLNDARAASTILKEIISTHSSGAAFPASQEDALPLLSFVYTLQRMQQAEGVIAVELKPLLKEMRKLDLQYMERVGCTSTEQFLEYALQHLDLRIQCEDNRPKSIGLNDITLPWLRKQQVIRLEGSAASEKQVDLFQEEKRLSPLAEILFCCNADYCYMDDSTLRQYLSVYDKVPLPKPTDIKGYCQKASKVCNLDIITTKKGFRIKLVNRLQPFKSADFNKNFFKRDFESLFNLKRKADEGEGLQGKNGTISKLPSTSTAKKAKTFP